MYVCFYFTLNSLGHREIQKNTGLGRVGTVRG
uniref:Uncharacterized protein n=1 Tax=Siphoviridae sp. ctXfh4 TaxID=2827887 RepID=A0A8S5SGJ0_9CAUD|nr:MAG TPA: hypothetical protein [Siphoviridae sp. ctXfh4]